MQAHIRKTGLLVMIAALVAVLAIPTSANSLRTRCTPNITWPSLNPELRAPSSIIRGPDGNVWFFAQYNSGGSGTIASKIIRMTPDGTSTEFPIPGFPLRMTAGPDGNIWYTHFNNGVVGRMTLSGTVTTFPISGTSPFGITAGSDGNVWITESSGNQVERMTPYGVVTGQFPIPTVNSNPEEIVSGPDGNLWFVENAAGKIGRITPSGVVSEFSVPAPGAYLRGITLGPDGNIWFTDSEGPKVGKITPDGNITEFLVAPQYIPTSITASSDGNLWVVNSVLGDIYPIILIRVTPDGSITEFPLGPLSSASIVSGGDGMIWFTFGYIGGGGIGTFDPKVVGFCTYLPIVSR